MYFRFQKSDFNIEMFDGCTHHKIITVKKGHTKIVLESVKHLKEGRIIGIVGVQLPNSS